MLVSDVLKAKSSRVVTVGSRTSLATATGIMEGGSIGALVVEDPAGTLVGLLSEREVVAALARRGAEALSRPVSEAMISDPATAMPGDALRQAMQVMTERRARHLPIMDGMRVIGLLSLGDVVKARLDEKVQENAVLQDMARWRQAA